MSITGHVMLSLHTQVNATHLKPDSGSTTLLCFEEGYSYSVQLLRLNNKWGGSTVKHKNYQCCRSVWNSKLVEHVLKILKLKWQNCISTAAVRVSLTLEKGHRFHHIVSNCSILLYWCAVLEWGSVGGCDLLWSFSEMQVRL